MMLTIRLSSLSFVLCAHFVAPGRLEVVVSGIAIPGWIHEVLFLSNSKRIVFDDILTKQTQADVNMVARKYDLDVYLALVHVSA